MTRSTEVNMVIMQNGLEKGMILLIQEVMERQSELELNMRENGAALLGMVQILDQITDGAGAMRTQIEKMQGGDEHDDTTPLAS